MADFLPAVPYFAPLPSLGQDDFLRLFDRLLPPYYLEPLKNPGPGYEYLQSVGAVMARVSEAVAHMGSGCYIGSATGGSRARGVVRLDRPSTLFGEVVLYEGTLVGTDDGYLYQTTKATGFFADSVGPLYVPVEALARGWEFNKPGEVTTEDGEVLPGSITRLVMPSLSTFDLNFDPTITVRQVSPTDVWPYTVTLPFTQPMVGGLVWIKLAATLIDLAPWKGARIHIGSAAGAQDFYEVVEVGEVSGSTITVQVRLQSYGLNAPSATVAAATQVFIGSETSGGSSQMLDALGNDRGLSRQINYGVVGFTRLGPFDQAVILKGSKLKTDDGYLYQTVEPAVFAENEAGPVYVRIIPLVLPDEYAAHGAPTLKDNIITLGYVGSLAFTNVVLYRVETDDAYRARIAMLPQVVTPSAMRFYIDQTIGTDLTVMGQTWAMREIWDIRFQTAYDTPVNEFYEQAEINVPVNTYSANVFAYDYENPDPLSNRYLDPDRGVVVFALPEVEGFEGLYASMAQALEAIKPAGITLAYILT